MFGIKTKKDPILEDQIKKLEIENKQLKQDLPTLREIIDTTDWSCLWRTDIQEGGLLKLMPIITGILALITLIIVLFKK